MTLTQLNKKIEEHKIKIDQLKKLILIKKNVKF